MPREIHISATVDKKLLCNIFTMLIITIYHPKVEFSGGHLGFRSTNLSFHPPAPMDHAKIFKGWPPRDAHSKLVQLWYKSFPPDQRGLLEMKNPTRLSNTTSHA